MTTYAVLNFIDFIVSLLLSALIALKGKNRKLVIPFVSWTFSISIWSLGVALHTLADINSNWESALFWSKFLHFGAVPLPTFYLHLVLTLCESPRQKLLSVSYLISIIFLLLIPTKYMISEVSPIGTFILFPKAGAAYPLFVLHFSLCVSYSIFILYQKYKITYGIERNQILYVLIGSSIGYGLGSTAFLPMFNFSVFPFGTPFVNLNAVLITYAIIRHRAMDLNLVMRWGIAYGISFVIFGGTILCAAIAIEYLVEKPSRGFPTLFAACIAVVLFDPIRRKISTWIDKFIFKSPDFKASLSSIEKILESGQPIEQIANELSAGIKNIWHVEKASFAIWNPKSAIFELYPFSSFSNEIITRMNVSIDRTDFLVKTLETERRLFQYGIIIEDEITALGNRSFIGERTTFWKMRRTMRWLGAAACVPLMVKNQLFGFLILGRKNNHSLYNNEDKKFLSHVAEMLSELIKKRILA